MDRLHELENAIANLCRVRNNLLNEKENEEVKFALRLVNPLINRLEHVHEYWEVRKKHAYHRRKM